MTYAHSVFMFDNRHFLNDYAVCLLIVFITGWVNRFAHAGDAAMEVAGNTAVKVGFSSANSKCHYQYHAHLCMNLVMLFMLS